MENHPNKKTKSSSSVRDTFDLDSILHPAKAYGHPMDVLGDEGLTLNSGGKEVALLQGVQKLPHYASVRKIQTNLLNEPEGPAKFAEIVSEVTAVCGS